MNRNIIAITRPQVADWSHAVALLNHLALQEDMGCFEMGDLLLQIEEAHGSKAVIDAADQCQIGRQVARQRRWIAKRFPPSHSLRRSHLTFSHFRTLVKLEKDEDVERWAQLAIENQWPVDRLVKEMEATSDEQAQQTGYPCIFCEKPLPEQGEIVSFSIGRSKRARCCNVLCAAVYFHELLRDSAIFPQENE